MKRRILVIAPVTVVALLVAIIFVYSQIGKLQNQIGAIEAQNSEMQDQLSELQNQLSELQLQNLEQQDRLNDFTYELAKARHLKVEISAFQWMDGFHPVGGLLIGHPVDITVRNNDVVPLSGLRLRVSLSLENTGAELGYVGGAMIGRLNAGESRVIRGEPWASLSTTLSDGVCVVTLAVGDIVLDSGVYSIS